MARDSREERINNRPSPLMCQPTGAPTTAAMASSSAPPPYDPSDMEQLRSWVHDDGRCVTAKSVMLDLGVSRGMASRMMADLPSFGGGAGEEMYEVHATTVAREGGKTVVKLVKSTVSSSDEGSALSSAKVYSIALLGKQGGAPTVRSGHESAMSTLRDMVLNSSETGVADAALDSSMRCDAVRPPGDDGEGENNSSLVKRVDARMGRRDRIAPSAASTTSSHPAFGATLKGSKKPAPKRKTTTAASFFRSSASSSKGKKTGPVPSKNPSTTHGKSAAKKTKPIEKAKEEKGLTSKGTGENKRRIIDDDDERIDAGNKKTETSAEEKENVENKAAVGKKGKEAPSKKAKAEEAKPRGSADDFIGDEDEDEDFLKEDAERKNRNAIKARKQIREEAAKEQKKAKKQLAPKKSSKKEKGMTKSDDVTYEDSDGEGQAVQSMDIDDVGDSKEIVYGAMDSFAHKGDKKQGDGRSSQETGKRRRKKLVEKTTMDEKGYIHTETVCVWEDIPSDEEDNTAQGSPPKKPRPSATGEGPRRPAAKKTKGMKQAGLMGFFSKKK